MPFLPEDSANKLASLKAPPHHLEAERAVLGAILIDNEALHKVLEFLREDDFYREAHRKIFRAMTTLSRHGEPTDIVTVCHSLEAEGSLAMSGGASYLSSLVDSIPSAANITAYGRIIREKAVLRSLIETANQIVTMGYDAASEADSTLDAAEKMIFHLGESRLSQNMSPVKDVVKDSFKKIEQLFEARGEITGLATGFRDFDILTSGLQPDDLIILAARPSMGKTSLAINIAENAAIQSRASVAVFSLEMSKEQLVMRMLCSQAMIDSSRLRKGQLHEDDWPRLTKAAGALSDVNIFIDDTPAISVMEMRSKARRLKREKNLGLIIVDYLQLVRAGVQTQNREQEIADISRTLKGMAKELKVPVLALSQLNRGVESRTNRRPQLSDLRESGAIEQDADIISFIYRDEVYDPQTPDKGVAEIIIGKHRNGPTGVVRLAFLNQYTKFENLAYDPNYGAPPDVTDIIA